MPPLSKTILMIHSSHTLLTSNNGSPTTIPQNSFSSSTDFANPPSRKSSSTSSESRKQVSFNPQTMIIQQTRDKSAFFNNPHATWYTEHDIGNFQRDAYFTIRRFHRQWQMGSNDCLRGLEGQTYKCSATKIRIGVYKELVLAKTDQTRRMIAKNPSRARDMMCIILKASKQDAVELANKDSQEAQRYQDPALEEEDDQAKCFFWELPKWFRPKWFHNQSPAIVDLPI